MKKLFVVLGLAVSSFSYANEPVTKKILTAFKQDFSTVTNVAWKSLETTGLYEATFLYNGEEMNAFYNEEGEMVGTSRYIKKAQLPILVQKEISTRYPEYIITTVIERSLNSSITYFITVNSLKKAMMLQAEAGGDITVYKRVKKISSTNN